MSRKVIHITSSLTGGAGVAALALAELQADNGDRVIIYTRTRNANSNHQNIQISYLPRLAVLGVLSKALTWIQQRLTSKDFGVLTIFSQNYLLMRRLKRESPTQIHIHNWYNLTNLRQITKISKSYKVVMHLHDERLFTGGCHNTLGCTNYLKNCTSCPAIKRANTLVNYNFVRESKLKRDWESIGLISPSNWMFDKHSNSIDHKITKQVLPNVTNWRFQKSIRPKKTAEGFSTALFIAADVNVELKRLNFAVQAINEWNLNNPNSQLRLKVIGGHSPEINKDTKAVTFVGSKNSEEIHKLMSEADVLFVTSSSENYPNVIVEGQLNHLIVISNSVGGVPEMIQDGQTGFLFKESKESFFSSLERFFSLSPDERAEMVQAAFNYQFAKSQPDRIYKKLNEFVDSL